MAKERSRRGIQRQYKMTVAGQLFKHFGLQMNAGAVPAISALLCNASDAMGRNRRVTIGAESFNTLEEEVVESKKHQASTTLPAWSITNERTP